MHYELLIPATLAVLAAWDAQRRYFARHAPQPDGELAGRVAELEKARSDLEAQQKELLLRVENAVKSTPISRFARRG
jgi:hypothetical protein